MLNLLALLLVVGCAQQQNSSAEEELVAEERVPNITIDSVAGLKVLYPNFTHIDLVCDTMPSESDSTVIFVAAA